MIHCMLLCIDSQILHVNFVFLNCCYYSIAYMIKIAFVFKEKPRVSYDKKEKKMWGLVNETLASRP